jgi:hypothetical protein
VVFGATLLSIMFSYIIPFPIDGVDMPQPEQQFPSFLWPQNSWTQNHDEQTLDGWFIKTRFTQYTNLLYG